jgi:hypothetical protein
MLVCLLTTTTIIVGCAKTRVYSPPPANLEDQVQVVGFENVRAWGDQDSPVLDNVAIESIKQEIAVYGEEELKQPVSYLVLSGGGENGAFGAGVLCMDRSGESAHSQVRNRNKHGGFTGTFRFLGIGL